MQIGIAHGGVPAFQGSDCSSVAGYAHTTTLWSTPLQSVVLVRVASVLMVLQGYSSTPAYGACRGTERHSSTENCAHRRQRALTRRRSSTVEAWRFFAVTSTTSAAAAASRLIAASCAHPIFGRSAQFFFTAGSALKLVFMTQKDPKKGARAAGTSLAIGTPMCNYGRHRPARRALRRNAPPSSPP